MTTLLHISDLHRTPDAEVSNTVMIHALRRDLSDMQQGIDVIVASGDIVQGTKDGGAVELARQYTEARAFLEGLADAFLGGDRERVVIVPGNHDVDWVPSRASMKAVPATGETRKHLLKKLFLSRSAHRWSWSEFEFYQITDRAEYQRRFAAFATFYDSFYKGARTYSMDPAKQFDIFDYPNWNLTIVGFNSCYDNDHCNYAGRIDPDCIASVGLALSGPRYANRSRVAVWHHNTKGLPQEANYMDVRILANLIDLRFALGLHGHQHRNDIVEEYAPVAKRQRMTIISAGSLCAGADEMPLGERRSYNIITLQDADSCVVRVRREHTDDPLAPLFGPSVPRGYSREEVELSLQTFPEILTMNATVREAEKHIAAGAHEKALALLGGLDGHDPMVRRLLFECFTELDHTADLVKHFYPPTSSLEILALMPALWVERELDKLQELLTSAAVVNSTDTSIRELTTKYTSLYAAKFPRKS